MPGVATRPTPRGKPFVRAHKEIAFRWGRGFGITLGYQLDYFWSKRAYWLLLTDVSMRCAVAMKLSYQSSNMRSVQSSLR